MVALPLDSLRAAAQSEPLGLYVHVPFCADRCTYCSFTSTCDLRFKPQVLARLTQDLVQWGEELGRPSVDTLYLGGGTPSTLSQEELTLLTTCVKASYERTGDLEATLEANPGTADGAWMTGARRLGWNRISLGIQTLDDGLLRRLGRIHDGAEGLAALTRAREAGFERISADLMIGIPGQNLERVRQDVSRLVEAGASHLSVYMLDLDKACPLKVQVESGVVQLPGEDAVAEAYEWLQEELPQWGFAAYEISNFAQPGQESRHNTRYWERRPYLGIGPSAASHLGDWRWTEDPNIEAWAMGVGLREVEGLDAATSFAEIPLLGLRMSKGIDWSALRSKAIPKGLLPLVETWERELEPLHHHGLLHREGSRLALTRKGILLSNRVLEVFI